MSRALAELTPTESQYFAILCQFSSEYLMISFCRRYLHKQEPVSWVQHGSREHGRVTPTP